MKCVFDPLGHLISAGYTKSRKLSNLFFFELSPEACERDNLCTSLRVVEYSGVVTSRVSWVCDRHAN